MNLLHTVVSFVVALAVLIVVHELGHYFGMSEDQLRDV